jgi:uncharacterized protein YecE (DUF72 family)
MELWIGTSGYSYTSWVGDFYPKGTKPRQMLSFYVHQFPLVELNFTYYRPPTAAMLARQADQTSERFQFLVKVPRSVSHEQKTDNLPGFRRAVEELRRRDQLLGVLCQLPQSTHNNAPARRWVERLAEELSDLELAVEFRHRSWAVPEVAPWLKEQHVDLVSVDVPNLQGLYPRGMVHSGSTVYVRLHSRDASKWYLAGADRYDYDYTDAELQQWIDATEETARQAGVGRFLFLFNNCADSLAANNARRLRELFAQQMPQANLIAPNAPVQRSLFE